MLLPVIQKKIHEVRGQKVMLDFDLAELYEVETRILNQSVKRNISRFPDEFMFQLNKAEWQVLISQIVISKLEKRGGTQKLPYAFTEYGVVMLASVLKSEKAVKMNITVVRAFIALREYVLTYKELAEKIAFIEKEMKHKFKDVNEALNYLLSPKSERKPIGYKTKKD